MLPNEELQKLRSASIRKKHGLDLAHPPSMTDAIARLIDDLTARYVSGDSHLSAQVDIDIRAIAGINFEPLMLLASSPNTSMAYALVEKKFHDAALPLFMLHIDSSQIQLREFRTKILYDDTTCRFVVSLDVREANLQRHHHTER